MPQFIQNAPEVANVGIGGQQVIQDRSPSTSKFLNNFINDTVSAAGAVSDVYSREKGKALVNEELANIDSAIAAAEDRSDVPNNIVNPNKPNDVNVSNDEFAIIESAVRNGAMSREKARLLASSRLKTRIAEQPLFADKLRQSASNVLGFNIESEPARQYFAAFKTDSQLNASSRSSYAEKIKDIALGRAEALDLDFNTVYKGLMRADQAETQLKLAETQVSLGGINANQFTTRANLADSESAFDQVITEAAYENKDGEFVLRDNVDNIALTRAIDTRRQAFLSRWQSGYTEAGGTVGSEDYTRQRSAINKRYDGYKDYIQEIGVDKLTKQKLERANQNRELLGNNYFGKFKVISDSLGSQYASEVSALLSNTTNESKLNAILDRDPLVKAVYDFYQGDTSQFGSALMDTANKVGNPDAELTDQEQQLFDFTSKELYKGSKGVDERDTVWQGIRARGQNFKALSLMTGESPRRASTDGKTFVKTMYKQDLPQALNRLGSIIQQNPNLNWSVEEDGQITVNPATGSGLPTTAPGGLVENPGEVQGNIADMSRANNLVNKINQFAIAHGKGWSTEFGETREDYINKVQSGVEEGMTAQRNQFAVETLNETAALIEEGDFETAATRYQSVQEARPEAFTASFSEIRAEIERRQREANQGGQ